MRVILVLVFVTLFSSVYSIDENTAGKLEKKKEDFQLKDEKLSFEDEDLDQDAEDESFDVYENENDYDNDDDDDDDKGVMNIWFWMEYEFLNNDCQAACWR